MSLKVKTKKITKNKTIQKFVRINIDEKLDVILSSYSLEYPLFSNAEIIKMLISKGISKNKKNSFSQILLNQEFINVDEKEQFQWLEVNQISRKSN